MYTYFHGTTVLLLCVTVRERLGEASWLLVFLCRLSRLVYWCARSLGPHVPRSLHLTLYRVGIDIIYTDSRVGTRLTPQAVVWVIGRGSALSQCTSESITLWKGYIYRYHIYVRALLYTIHTNIYTHIPLVVKVIPPREE